MKLVIMGVSGCGKSSVGEALSIKLGATYTDGDDLHPEANLKKMAAGIPLEDEDRWPWLAAVGQRLQHNENSVVACSALKRSYRNFIRQFAPETKFIHLHGTRELLESRLASRVDDFMPSTLLDSQLNTLESLQPTESGKVFDISKPVSELVTEILEWLKID